MALGLSHLSSSGRPGRCEPGGVEPVHGMMDEELDVCKWAICFRSPQNSYPSVIRYEQPLSSIESITFKTLRLTLSANASAKWCCQFVDADRFIGRASAGSGALPGALTKACVVVSCWADAPAIARVRSQRRLRSADVYWPALLCFQNTSEHRCGCHDVFFYVLVCRLCMSKQTRTTHALKKVGWHAGLQQIPG